MIGSLELGTGLLLCGLPHMETSARYLEYAVQCNRLAKLAKMEEDRMILKEMAEAWKKLAREADRSNER